MVGKRMSQQKQTVASEKWRRWILVAFAASLITTPLALPAMFDSTSDQKRSNKQGPAEIASMNYNTGGRMPFPVLANSTASPSSQGSAVFDIDSDGKTDLAYYRGAGLWSMLKSGDSTAKYISWGDTNSTLAYGDFDGDGKIDPAYIVPESGGQNRLYAILKSSANYSYDQPLFVSAGYSALGDIPVVGDFDGDGKADPSIWRASQGLWILQNSSSNYGVTFVYWGQNGDTPIVADFDGDGKSDIGFYRNGVWGILLSTQNYTVAQWHSWGGAGLAPIVADFDGDGKADIAYVAPPSGGQSAVYSILLSSRNYSFASGQVLYVPAGYPSLGDTPVVGDWDGDGKADPGIWRSTQGVWIIPLSSSNNYSSYLFAQWGQQGDKPMPGKLNEYLVPRGQPTGSGDNFSKARVDPINRVGQPGEDLFSGNYNWSVPVVGLAGRAGLDLGLSLSYNSLVWTRDGNSIGFDADRGFPTPGFRLGFPTIQQGYVSQSGSSALLMILPSGSRVELRQVSGSLYESADSSWFQLDTSVNPMILRTADGTQLSFQSFNGEYKCTQVKDRNGNYISVAYDAGGHITTITDTLGRIITFVYLNNNLQKITQLWNGTDHVWAQFDYNSLTIQTSFTGLSIIGPQNGTSITVLSKVTLDDGSYFTFDYTSYGQVKKMSHNAADLHLLASTAYDMNTATGQTDCPRFTTRTDYAENWNTVNTSFTFDRGAGPGSVTTPDLTLTKETHSVSGYNKGLTTQVDTYSGDNLNTPKRTVAITWTQDNTGVSYPLNPRVTETDITDDASNLKRTTISYSGLALPSGTTCSVPSDVKEYASDGTTVLRKTHTDYVTTSSYLNQHIIGLPSARYLYDSDTQGATPVSKVTFGYDAAGSLSSPGEPVQHDSSYGTGFTARGNSTSVTRWDVTTLGNQTPQSVTSTMSYNTAGDVISTSDPLSHQVTISYTDSFAATGTTLPSSTLAYPTTITDADSKSSTVQYDYDLGVAKVTTDPKGATLTKTFDLSGRVTRIESNLMDSNNNHAYTRFVYQSSMTEVDTYILQSTMPTVEIYSAQFLDGAGRVISTRRELPGSNGGYSGQKFVYDTMGRLSQQSNPTEVDTSGTPAGDDAGAWKYTTQSYDWKGRPLITTNTDTTTRTVTYGGCGCAGGEVVTTQDEVLRKQKMTYDVLGRLLKTEVLNADLTTYSTTKNTYNARDQVTLIRQYQGSDTSTTFQDTAMTYDGHGRLSTRKAPIEDSATTYAYYSDDTVQTVTDPRGARSTFTYNGRHLVTGISYAKPGNAPIVGPSAITPVPAVTFDYDAGGNRLLMTDGLGRVDYVHDMWSRLTSETRTFNDFPNSTYPLNYAYNLAGELKQLTDAFSSVTSYSYNQAGQLTSVAGSGPNSAPSYISQIGYRAWGAPKQISYGNGLSMTMSYNSRLQVSSFNVPGLLGATLTYYSDGRIHASKDTIDRTFDRAYNYDQVGRMTEALTGSGAGLGSALTGPYHQSYDYDAFGNMTSRAGRLWTGSDNGYSTTYVNDRDQNWSYNAEGDAVTQTTLTAVFDAAGRRSSSTAPSRRIGTQTVNLELDETYDGDGQQVKEVKTIGTTVTPTCRLRSSLLGGQIVDEIDGSGAKATGFIYAGGQPIARYQSTQLLWVHRDPLNTRERLSSSTGALSGGAEYDPSHSSVGLEDPGPSPGGDGTDPGLMYPRNGDPTDFSGGCMIDGGVAPCSVAMSQVNVGAGVATDPYETPSTRWNPQANNGQGRYEVFHVLADGFVGYMPVNATYVSNGYWRSPGSEYGGRLATSAGQSGRGKITYLEPKNPINPWIESIVDGFTKLTKCLEAYEALGIDLKKLLDKGIVVGGSHLLTDVWHDAKSLGLTQYTYNESKQNIDTGIDAFTIAPEYRNFKTGNEPLVTDGRPHIFLNAGATTNGYNRLKEDLAHELIHAGGYAGRAPGFFRALLGKNDLYYLDDKLNAVERECGDVATPP